MYLISNMCPQDRQYVDSRLFSFFFFLQEKIISSSYMTKTYFQFSLKDSFVDCSKQEQPGKA